MSSMGCLNDGIPVPVYKIPTLKWQKVPFTKRSGETVEIWFVPEWLEQSRDKIERALRAIFGPYGRPFLVEGKDGTMYQINNPDSEPIEGFRHPNPTLVEALQICYGVGLPGTADALQVSK